MNSSWLPWIAGAIVVMLVLVTWRARVERRQNAARRPIRRNGHADKRPPNG